MTEVITGYCLNLVSLKISTVIGQLFLFIFNPLVVFQSENKATFYNQSVCADGKRKLYRKINNPVHMIYSGKNPKLLTNFRKNV